MAHQVNRLSARAVRAIAKPGRHADGRNLYLDLTATGVRSWVFLYKFGGRQREMGLGSLDAVPLARARELATDARQVLAEGRDPLTIKPAPKALTFGEIADQYIEAKRGEWHNAKHAAQWEMTLREYAAPIRSFAVTRSAQRTFCAA
jgi:hypothetical protein